MRSCVHLCWGHRVMTGPDDSVCVRTTDVTSGGNIPKAARSLKPWIVQCSKQPPDGAQVQFKGGS